MTTERQGLHDEESGRLAMYREIQRSIPGLDTIYRLAAALIAAHASPAPRVLVVGAGGGREIETFLADVPAASITAVDPSAGNLALARHVAGNANGVHFVEGRMEDLHTDAEFDVATSLLVMHQLPDDGAKLSYLCAIRDRLGVGGALVHADVCFDDPDEFERLVPIYQAYARHIGASAEATQLELGTIPALPAVSSDRIRALFEQAGLASPREVFRSLWYRCWVSGHAPTSSKVLLK
ncbi:class I SAM-dependent methyltransferase [Rhodobacteraceae bacterium CCMM004]|nr:class I SAM-dependent methyltransferase [Rhodobacteraceae bacterium CCMM004]